MDAEPTPKTRHRLLIQFSGELALKGKSTRSKFVDRLAQNLADALRSHGMPSQVDRRWSRLTVEAPSLDAIEVAKRVFGVWGVARVEKRSWRQLDDLLDHGEEIFADQVAGRTFAVRAHRGEHSSQHDFRSTDIERQLGSRLFDRSAGVDLTSPDVEAHVELRGDEAHFYARFERGEGGLPIGTEGRALALVSGGFDSPVAAWNMLRRGVRLDYLFCNLGGDSHLRDVLEVMKVIADRWSYGYRPRLHVVDFRPVVEALRARCEPYYWQVLLKRQMLRMADGLAKSQKAAALVTGEAVGQVSSQTLHNLSAISGVTDFAILRPVATWSKEEIVDAARRIGTADRSEKVPEYCALHQGRTATHTKRQELEEQEKHLDIELLKRLFDERVTLDLRRFNPGALDAGHLETANIPKEAAVLDMRSARAFSSWHYPGARHLPYPDALESFRDLDSGPTYVAYCEVGLKSAHLAEVMNDAGWRAHHVARGVGTVLRQHRDESDPALLAALSPALRRD